MNYKKPSDSVTYVWSRIQNPYLHNGNQEAKALGPQSGQEAMHKAPLSIWVSVC